MKCRETGKAQHGPLAHRLDEPCPNPNYRGECECPGPCSMVAFERQREHCPVHKPNATPAPGDRCRCECQVEPAELDPLGVDTLSLFLSLQTQWTRAGMSERRTGIPREAVRIEAAARGIELSESLLDKFRACENVLIGQDAERVEEAANNNQPPQQQPFPPQP